MPIVKRSDLPTFVITLLKTISFRFMPHETPPVKIFPVKGMKINVRQKPKFDHQIKVFNEVLEIPLPNF